MTSPHLILQSGTLYAIQNLPHKCSDCPITDCGCTPSYQQALATALKQKIQVEMPNDFILYDNELDIWWRMLNPEPIELKENDPIKWEGEIKTFATCEACNRAGMRNCAHFDKCGNNKEFARLIPKENIKTGVTEQEVLFIQRGIALRENQSLSKTLSFLYHEFLDKESEGKPRVVCFCGSTRFADHFMIERWKLEKQGIITLGINILPHGYFGEQDHHGAEQEGVKHILDELHKRKIDLSDEIFVLDVGGYIGESTRSEIEYAEKTGKPVKYLTRKTTSKPEEK